MLVSVDPVAYNKNYVIVYLEVDTVTKKRNKAVQPNQRDIINQPHYDSSLETSSAEIMQAIVTPESASRLSAFKFSRRAVVISSVATLLVLLMGVGSLLFSNTSTRKQAADAAAAYSVGPLSVKAIAETNQTVKLGQADYLDIDGVLAVTKTIIVAPTVQPAKATAGQIYYDETTNQPYYYDGTAFVSLAPQVIPASVTSLGGVSGVIRVGNGLQLADGQLALSAAT